MIQSGYKHCRKENNMPATLEDIQKKYGKGGSVYPLYKNEMHAPYMENETGNGYKGVVLYRKDIDAVQCSECGQWFENLSIHVKIHGINAMQYREKNGLFKKTSLSSKRLSRQRSELATRRISEGYSILQKDRNLVSSANLKKSQNIARSSFQFQNKYGLCEAQVSSRLMVVKEMSGNKNITSADISRYDRKLYDYLRKSYGSVEKACEKFNIEFLGQGNNRYEDAEVIALLRLYVLENKEIPTLQMIDDINIGFSSGVIYKHFGSWRRAKMMAGLNKLLSEVKNE